MTLAAISPAAFRPKTFLTSDCSLPALGHCRCDIHSSRLETADGRYGEKYGIMMDTEQGRVLNLLGKIHSS